MKELGAAGRCSAGAGGPAGWGLGVEDKSSETTQAAGVQDSPSTAHRRSSFLGRKSHCQMCFLDSSSQQWPQGANLAGLSQGLVMIETWSVSWT